jgi:hypothetical protein
MDVSSLGVEVLDDRRLDLRSDFLLGGVEGVVLSRKAFSSASNSILRALSFSSSSNALRMSSSASLVPPFIVVVAVEEVSSILGVDDGCFGPANRMLSTIMKVFEKTDSKNSSSGLLVTKSNDNSDGRRVPSLNGICYKERGVRNVGKHSDYPKTNEEMMATIGKQNQCGNRTIGRMREVSKLMFDASNHNSHGDGSKRGKSDAHARREFRLRKR